MYIVFLTKTINAEHNVITILDRLVDTGACGLHCLAAAAVLDHVDVN